MQAKAMQEEKKRLESGVAAAKSSVSGVQRSLAVPTPPPPPHPPLLPLPPNTLLNL